MNINSLTHILIRQKRNRRIRSKRKSLQPAALPKYQEGRLKAAHDELMPQHDRLDRISSSTASLAAVRKFHARNVSRGYSSRCARRQPGERGGRCLPPRTTISATSPAVPGRVRFEIQNPTRRRSLPTCGQAARHPPSPSPRQDLGKGAIVATLNTRRSSASAFSADPVVIDKPLLREVPITISGNIHSTSIFSPASLPSVMSSKVPRSSKRSHYRGQGNWQIADVRANTNLEVERRRDPATGIVATK